MAFRNGDGKPRADQRALARPELVPVAGGEVETCVADVRPRREHRVGSQPRDRELDHAAGVTRKRANRRTSRSGKRALISTPSSRSVRDSIGGPSA